MSDYKDRIGRIKVSEKFERIHEVNEIFGKLQFFPLRVEYMYVTREFDMIGYSPLFDVCPAGMFPPEYVIEAKTKEDPKEGDCLNVSVRRGEG